MRKLLTVTFLTISVLAFGQDYNFKPNWKKGESKTVIITHTEKEYKKGELISDTTTFNEASIKVIKASKESYTLEILYENVALKSAIELYAKLGEELADYKNLKLIYKVNKETAESELVNWKEAQDFMNESFDQITTIFEKKVPEMVSFTSLIFLPIKEIFKSKENIEGYMETEIGYILTPFNKNFKLGETISKTETSENPFNPMQEISATTNLILKEVDKNNSTCIINQTIELDLSEFKEMIKTMIQKMAQSFGANDSITDSTSKEFDEFEMDMTNEQIITFDYKSSWVTKVLTTSSIIGTDPKEGKRKTEAISTVIIK